MKVNKDISQALFEEIELYLTGEMDPVRELAFEEKMKNDSVFAEEVLVQKKLQAGILHSNMKKRLNSIHQELYTSNTHSSSRYWWWSAAAILLIVFGLWFSARPSKNEKLFAQYFTQDPGLPTPMSATSEKYAFFDAMVCYKNQEYEIAIAKFDSLKAENSGETRYRYYLASSYLNSGQAEKAIPFYKEIAETSGNKYQTKAQWYLALCYLKLEQYEQLNELLQKPVGGNEERFEELQKQLNEN